MTKGHCTVNSPKNYKWPTQILKDAPPQADADKIKAIFIFHQSGKGQTA